MPRLPGLFGQVSVNQFQFLLNKLTPVTVKSGKKGDDNSVPSPRFSSVFNHLQCNCSSLIPHHNHISSLSQPAHINIKTVLLCCLTLPDQLAS